MAAKKERVAHCYIPKPMLAEMRAQADRLERSLSWVAQQAWKIARSRLKTNETMREKIGQAAQRVMGTGPIP